MNVVMLSVVVLLLWIIFFRLCRKNFFIYSLVSLVGSALHELSHLVVGICLGGKPAGFTLRPKRQGGRWIFGEVSFYRLRLWNKGFVALAPLLLWGISGWLYSAYLIPALLIQNWLYVFVYGYLIVLLALSGIPSREDWKVGGWSVVLYVVLLCISVFVLN